jgi:RNA polymerase sigma factor (sigma-70 family)
MDDLNPPRDARSSSFHTTRWSLVLSAGHGSGPESEWALALLCQIYWYPLYAYIRRHAASADDAQDMTQDFFVHVLDKNVLARASRERGRFRAFLLASMKNFLANARDQACAQKRGGGRRALSLDWQNAESRVNLHPLDRRTAERWFEHDWAVTLLDRVLASLREEFESAGKASYFAALQGSLARDGSGASYAAIARQFDISEAAARQAVHRLRRRYRELLRAEIADTVADPAEIDDEIRSLFVAIGS